MPFNSFTALFRDATKNPAPFPYQVNFAEADELWELIHAPTGAGKTATAVLGWLWRKFLHKNHAVRTTTPRRLVYCLPMRVLVEQTRDEVSKWLDALNPHLPEAVKAYVLMGGEDENEWDLDPEKPAVLIGTQDMLLSRALNRGYGMSRFRWPMHFGLLNNDCLWVLDEIQLMGTGLATSTQLQAFRETFGTYGTVKTVWMSATLLPGWLASVDYRDRIEPELRLRALALDPKADYQADGLRERWEAKKAVLPADLASDDAAGVARFVKNQHQTGSLTLVIVNTVDRSRAVFGELKKLYQPQRRGRAAKDSATSEPTVQPPELKLIHSRFRPKERERWREWLDTQELPIAGRIVVSTQVVEAGVDISARTLVTELAPWPSLVQRFGRCNRRGEFLDDTPARVFWVDVPSPDEKKAAPYLKAELDVSRERIQTRTDVGLRSLTDFFDGLSVWEREHLFPFDPPHVIRRKDFVDLFDTTTDLAGNDIDVSRFIRDGDDIDVQVFWRAGEPPKGELTATQARRLAPTRDELCPVKLAKDGGIKGFLESHPAYRWDSLASLWIKAEAADVYPGQVYWIATDEGGYDETLGWSPESKWSNALWRRDPDVEQGPETTDEPGYDTELLSVYGWRSIAEHTQDVIEEIDTILTGLAFKNLPRTSLLTAARWHDWGKAHDIFQAAIRDEANGEQRPAVRIGRRDIAKAAPKSFWQPYTRPHFRHEIASSLGVLALLKSGHVLPSWVDLGPLLQDLALYLIAAHHGKVRLSIRSMPGEVAPDDAGALFARGVWASDELPEVDLGGGVTTPAVRLDLSPMMLGRAEGHPSWAERTLRLRDHAEFGPLRLAFLETMLRAADIRASKDADQKAKVAKGARS